VKNLYQIHDAFKNLFLAKRELNAHRFRAKLSLMLATDM
jgi:hypothetical protein